MRCFSYIVILILFVAIAGCGDANLNPDSPQGDSNGDESAETSTDEPEDEPEDEPADTSLNESPDETEDTSVDELPDDPADEPEDEPEDDPEDDPEDEDSDACEDGVTPSFYYNDLDDDGFGDADVSVEACSAPDGYVANSTDCNDSNADVHPDATEVCDGVDNDCDGTIDKGLSAAEIGFDSLFDESPLDIGNDLPAGYEPSGVIWHADLDILFVVSDGGIVTSMDVDGGDLENKTIGGDLEAVTIADPETDFIYIGVENPDSVLEYNFVTKSVTRQFFLDGYMTGPSNAGLEALAFVPDDTSDEGGYFYAGLQATGEIFVFELPIVSSETSTTVTFIESFSTQYSFDISDLFYDPIDDILYAIYDSSNRLVSMEIDGTFISKWVLPLNNQEAFALDDSCHVYVGEDSNSVWRY